MENGKSAILKYGNHIDSYNADENGQMFIKNRPSWINIVFMLPYPFFCFGCFTSSSCNIEFDNNTKTLTIKTWPGYLYCCSKTTQIIEYNSIGNIGYGKSSCNQNHEPLYYPIIVLKDGHIFKIGDSKRISHLRKQVLGIHKFVFDTSTHVNKNSGRNYEQYKNNESDYVVPNESDIKMEELDSDGCCKCCEKGYIFE